MREALKLAARAEVEGEVPVGAVVVRAGEVVGRGWNGPVGRNDPTAHAEMAAIREAAARLGNYRLDGCDLYVTLEPCVMCAGGLVHARVSKVVYGCEDPKGGAVDTLYRVGRDGLLNHGFELTRGVLGAECADRLRVFFAALRGQGKK